MALIDFRLNDITVTASTMGEHFAIHPAVMIGDDGELHLDGAAWFLQHVPSGKQAMILHHADPIEFPGEPRALDLTRVMTFVEWLESRIDCSAADVDFSTLSRGEQIAVSTFRAEPNYWTTPREESAA